jgi:hypothetical protein
MEQYIQHDLSFFLLFQPVFQAGFFDLTEIISRRNPLPDFSSQEDRTTRNIAAFGARLKSAFLDATVPNAAPRMLFTPLATETSTGRFGLVLAAESTIEATAANEILWFVMDNSWPFSRLGRVKIIVPVCVFDHHEEA